MGDEDSLDGLDARRQRSLYLYAVRSRSREPYDIRAHFPVYSPEREHSVEFEAPIEYAPLRSDHLPAIHDLLQRLFWDGIEGMPPCFPNACLTYNNVSERLSAV